MEMGDLSPLSTRLLYLVACSVDARGGERGEFVGGGDGGSGVLWDEEGDAGVAGLLLFVPV